MTNTQIVEVKKYDYIDALRGIAVLGTLMVHCSIYDKGSNNYGDFFKAFTFTGAMGVQLFFIMSAFTLFLSYDLKSGKEKRPILNYFLRRIFRIAPLFYVAAIFYLIVIGTGPRYWLGDQPSITWANILATFTFTNSVNPYWINSIVEGGWSIAIEMVFYITIPFLFAIIKKLRTALWALGFSIIASSLFYMVMVSHPQIPEKAIWNSFIYFSFPSQLPVFLLGISLYYLIKENDQVNILSKEITYPLILLIAIFFIHILNHHIQEHILFGFLFFFIAWAVSKNEIWIIVNPLTRFLGKISYSMYLTHFGVLFLMWKLNILDLLKGQMVNYALRYTLLIIITAAISYITYKTIEVPGQNLGRKIIKYFENK